MCCFSQGRDLVGLVKAKPPGSVFPSLGLLPHPGYFSFPSGWDHGSSLLLRSPVCFLRRAGCSCPMSHRAVFNSGIPLLGFFWERNHLMGQFLQNAVPGPFALTQREELL